MLFPTPVAPATESSQPLAFVDVETTGLSPGSDRITEVGVVTVAAGRVERWTSRVNPYPRDRARLARRPDAAELAAAPAFAAIADDLARRLSGRLLVAHNARFDYAFLRAEFERAGRSFEASVLCSLMLARRVCPDVARHDLDTLAAQRGLAVDVRHRALPDADLLWQFWESLHADLDAHALAAHVEALLQGPVLPAQLDPSLIDRLPDLPGVYVLFDEARAPLAVAAADNLRVKLRDYFRIDRATRSALALAHRVADIRWQTTQGAFGARLKALSMTAGITAGTAAGAASDVLPAARRRAHAACVGWRLAPGSVPCVRLQSLTERGAMREQETFGMFASPRKAANALARLAAQRRLCHTLLGLAAEDTRPCRACPVDAADSMAPGRSATGCLRRVDRAAQLAHIFVALRPWRVPPWPWPGAVGIRERREMHVFDDWRYLGSARGDHEVRELLQDRPGAFDRGVFALLAARFSAPARRDLIDLSALAESVAVDGADAHDAFDSSAAA